MSTAATQPAWAPAIPDFDGARIDRFPRLFLSAPEIERAARRIQSEPWAAAVLERLRRQADEAFTLDAQPLDESWWNSAQSRPWEETYPLVFQHTFLAPARYARTAAACALVWTLTRETRYADRACDLLLLLAPCSFSAEHYDVGMNYAAWAAELLLVYDLLGTRLAPAERRQVDAFMTRLARAVLRNDVYWITNNIGGGLNNHLAWHKMMLGLLGLFYDRPELVQFCVEGTRGMLPLLGEGLLDHGLWCESSLNYHFTAIVPMIRFADAQRRLAGRSELLAAQAVNGRTLKQPFDAMFDVLFPDGSIPPVGDAYAHRARLFNQPIYEHAWAAWGDPRYAWLLGQCRERSREALFTPDLPAQVEAPTVASILLPEHGYVFLREQRGGRYWNTPARCVFLTYDRAGVHSNADRLSLMLFGEGRLLLADREARASVPHAFSSQVQRELNRGTICHNTVMIDGQDQRGTAQVLRLLEYHVTPAEQRATVCDPDGLLYPGVRQMRTVILCPEYVLDVFQVDGGDTPHQIDWIAHPFEESATLPTATNPVASRAKPFPLPDSLPWKWLRTPRTTAVSPPLTLQWESAGTKLRLALHSEPDASLILCAFPLTDDLAGETREVMILRRQAKRTTVAAAWTSGPDPLEVRVLTESLPDLRYRITWNAGSRQHIIPRLSGV